jgi:protein phosphatase 1 regulatory subunit 7
MSDLTQHQQEDPQVHEPETSSAKPRARLGPTEVVILPNSDSEDEHDDDHGSAKIEDAEADSEDFLKSYPVETEVRSIRLIRRLADVQELQLQHLRLKTPQLVSLQFNRFNPHLKRLCLRQNDVTSPIPPEAFGELDALEEIDLYDNRLGPRVEDDELAGCSNVT